MQSGLDKESRRETHPQQRVVENGDGEIWAKYHIWSTNRTGENRTGEPRPLDWTLPWALPWTPSWSVSWELSRES